MVRQFGVELGENWALRHSSGFKEDLFMTADVVFVILGLALLVAGGEVMIRGATGLASGLGVSPLAIGLTVVAFGTSAPELAVNVNAALDLQLSC